jgi:hypothetical protein
MEYVLNVHENIVQHDYNMSNLVDNDWDMKHRRHRFPLLDKNKIEFIYLLKRKSKTYDYKQILHRLN